MGGRGNLVESRVENRGESQAVGAADTLPATPARRLQPSLWQDAAYLAMQDFVARTRASLAGRAWDNLAHIEAFSRALRFCQLGVALDDDGVTDAADAPPAPTPLLARFPGDLERRQLALLLCSLLPPASPARAFRSLPPAVTARAEQGFPLSRSDVPRISAALSAHLADPRLLSRALVPGARVLAPRSACPFAAQGGALVLHIDSVAERGGLVRGRAVLPDGSFVETRRSADGKPLLTVEGREQPIELPVDAVVGFIVGAGPDARGLDLRFADDRCLLLCTAALWRERGVFARLAEGDGLTRAQRMALVEEALQAAFDATWMFTLDPLASAVVLRKHTNDLGWPERAWAALSATGAVRDAAPREPRDGFARDALWVDAVLAPGFAGGRLTHVAAGRAFARLVTSLLAPLGVLPCSGHKDGSGAVLLQTVLPPDEEHPEAPAILGAPRLASFGSTPRLETLEAAWREGRGTHIPEPRGHPQHDLPSMASWMEFFLDALDADPDAAFEEVQP